MQREKVLVDALQASLTAQGLFVSKRVDNDPLTILVVESGTALYRMHLVRLDEKHLLLDTLHVEDRATGEKTEVVKYHPSGGMQFHSVEGANAFKLEEYANWCQTWWKE